MDSLVGRKKQEISIKELCKDHPEEFQKYMEYCRNDLGFRETPDYEFLVELLKTRIRQNGYDSEIPSFCWNGEHQHKLANKAEAHFTKISVQEPFEILEKLDEDGSLNLSNDDTTLSKEEESDVEQKKTIVIVEDKCYESGSDESADT